MKFRGEENRLIWEEFAPMDYKDPEAGYDDSKNDKMDMGFEDEAMGGYEDNEVMIVTEPMGELEVAPEEGNNIIGDEHSDEDELVYSDLKKLAEYSKRLACICKAKEMEPWMKAKIIKASDYVSDVYYRLDAKADFANDQDDITEF